MVFMMQKRMRKLKSADMIQMRVGRRFWSVSRSKIPDHLLYRKAIESYISELLTNVSEGRGILFSGKHGSGKTASAVILAKAVESHYGSALFVSADEVQSLIIEKTMFDEDQTLLQRLLDVDLLIIDDLGEEHIREFSKSVVERIIRTRSNNLKSIIGTTNKFEKLPKMYGEGTIEVMKACMLPQEVSGHDWRDFEREQLEELMGEDDVS